METRNMLPSGLSTPLHDQSLHYAVIVHKLPGMMACWYTINAALLCKRDMSSEAVVRYRQ